MGQLEQPERKQQQDHHLFQQLDSYPVTQHPSFDSVLNSRSSLEVNIHQVAALLSSRVH